MHRSLHVFKLVEYVYSKHLRNQLSLPYGLFGDITNVPIS